jgi:hypothetical protein
MQGASMRMQLEDRQGSWGCGACCCQGAAPNTGLAAGCPSVVFTAPQQVTGWQEWH